MLRSSFWACVMLRAYRRMKHNGPSTLPCRTPIVTWTLVTGLPRLFRMMYHVPAWPASSTTDSPFNFAASETAADRRSLGMVSHAFSRSNKKPCKETAAAACLVVRVGESLVNVFQDDSGMGLQLLLLPAPVDERTLWTKPCQRDWPRDSPIFCISNVFAWLGWESNLHIFVFLWDAASGSCYRPCISARLGIC